MGPQGPWIETALFHSALKGGRRSTSSVTGPGSRKTCVILPFIHSYPHKQSNACVQSIELWSRPSQIRLNTIGFTGCSPAARAKPFGCEMKEVLSQAFFSYIQLNHNGFASSPVEGTRLNTPLRIHFLCGGKVEATGGVGHGIMIQQTNQSQKTQTQVYPWWIVWHREVCGALTQHVREGQKTRRIAAWIWRGSLTTLHLQKYSGQTGKWFRSQATLSRCLWPAFRGPASCENVGQTHPSDKVKSERTWGYRPSLLSFLFLLLLLLFLCYCLNQTLVCLFPDFLCALHLLDLACSICFDSVKTLKYFYIFKTSTTI